jgi:hypothetical protein
MRRDPAGGDAPQVVMCAIPKRLEMIKGHGLMTVRISGLIIEHI